MLRSYQPFVTIDPGNNVVGLNVAINNHSDIARLWPEDMPKVYSAIIKSSVELIIEKASPTGLYKVESEIIDLFRRRPDLEHAAAWPTYVRRLARIGENAFDDVKGVINKLFDNQEHYLFAIQLYLYTKEDYFRPTMSWDALCTWILSIGRLQIAAQWGLTWIVQQILRETPEEISKCDSRATTALHEASKRGFTEIIKTLLEKAPPVDCFDAEGKTPLEYALENKDSETFVYLFNAQVTTSPKSISNEMVSTYCKTRLPFYDVDDRRLRELTVLRIVSGDDEQQAKCCHSYSRQAQTQIVWMDTGGRHFGLQWCTKKLEWCMLCYEEMLTMLRKQNMEMNHHCTLQQRGDSQTSSKCYSRPVPIWNLPIGKEGLRFFLPLMAIGSGNVKWMPLYSS
ncbi:hypothetical protein F4680DRAFT_116356 [Xylaria scruposa]|nr:hypothetical protein F4680DRAFT_116356 [Xylaria scruposa]